MSNKYTIIVRATLDKVDLQKQITELQNNINASANNLPKVTAGASGASKNIESMAKGMKNVQMSAVDVSSSLVKWGDKLENIRSRNEKLFDSDPKIQGINTDIKSMISNFDGTKASAKEINNEIMHLNSSFSTLSNGIRNVSHDGDDFQQMMAKNIKKVAEWAIATTAIYGTLKQIGEAVQFIKDLNKEMTNIQVVTGMSKKEVTSLAQEFNKLALELSATTIEISSGSLEWFRQGKTIEETSELMRSTMMMAKLGNLDSAQSTEYLTSTLNGFKLEAKDSLEVVDKLTNLDNQYATSVGEIAEALQKSSNSAQQAGVTFDELASYITVLSSVTRKSASSLGESMKTMFARLSAIKLGEMFEDDTTNINDVEKALSLVDIQLRDSATSFRDMGDVMDEIASKWDSMNELEQSAIATTVAGKMYARTYSDIWEFVY